MKPFTFIFWVRGEYGPDRYLIRAEANSQTDANRRGKAHAKAEGIRFIEATQETVVPSASDALEIRQLIVKIEL